jgi:hypothetical protein
VVAFTRRNLIVGLSVSLCLFSAVNFVHNPTSTWCADCFRPHGVPFTYFREGGFAGGGGFVWPGVMGDSLVAIAFGMATAWVLLQLTRKA